MPCRPGCQLKRILSWALITPVGDCRCNERAAEMNRRGPDWCQENADTIVGWLREEAAARGLSFVEIAARAAVSLAIARARAAG
jgi:hypothetical protein